MHRQGSGVHHHAAVPHESLPLRAPGRERKLVFLEYSVEQLEIILVDYREILLNVNVGDVVAADVVQGFVHVALREVHQVAG